MTIRNSDGFIKVSCLIADHIQKDIDTDITSAKTDVEGLIYREWSNGKEEVVMKEYYWPKDDTRDCEHWVLIPMLPKEGEINILISANRDGEAHIKEN